MNGWYLVGSGFDNGDEYDIVGLQPADVIHVTRVGAARR